MGRGGEAPSGEKPKRKYLTHDLTCKCADLHVDTRVRASVGVPAVSDLMNESSMPGAGVLPVFKPDLLCF